MSTLKKIAVSAAAAVVSAGATYAVKKVLANRADKVATEAEQLAAAQKEARIASLPRKARKRARAAQRAVLARET